MKLPTFTHSPWFGAVTVALIVGGALVVQHLTHGWPFSLHHGADVDGGGGGVAPPAASGAPEPAAGDPHAAHVLERSDSKASEAQPPKERAEHVRVPVEVGAATAERSGITVEVARAEDISRPLRVTAAVAADEARVSHIHTRVSGWIEALHVPTTGQLVKAGEPLASIFSQELLASQTEYLAALKASDGGPPSAIAAGARSRLKVLGMGDGEIRAIEKSGRARRLVTVTAPNAGVVLHRGIAVGTAVDPSTEIMTIVDLSEIWVLAEVPSAEAARIAVGTRASIELQNARVPPIETQVAFIYPIVSERTRTLTVRFAVPNPQGALRPGLYGTVRFDLAPHVAITVPRDAVVDTGEEQHVFVVEHPGHYVPRTVKIGDTLADRVEITEGLKAGESVVASGVFLIDSESRLRASGGTRGHAHGSGDQGGSEKAAPAEAPDAGASPGQPDGGVREDPHAGHGSP